MAVHSAAASELLVFAFGAASDKAPFRQLGRRVRVGVLKSWAFSMKVFEIP